MTTTLTPVSTRPTIALDADEVELVLALALDPTEEIDTRVRAVEELAEVTDPRAGAACLELLDDDAAPVRFWSVYSLWRLAATGRIAVEDVAAPLHRLATGDTGVVAGWWSVRKEALDALVGLGLLARADDAANGFERHRLDELRFARRFSSAAGLAPERQLEIANEVQVARSATEVAISFAWLGTWTCLPWDGTAGTLAALIESTADEWATQLRIRAAGAACDWDRPA